MLPYQRDEKFISARKKLINISVAKQNCAETQIISISFSLQNAKSFVSRTNFKGDKEENTFQTKKMMNVIEFLKKRYKNPKLNQRNV